jgi:xanthine dehydrogenase accessory factor
MISQHSMDVWEKIASLHREGVDGVVVTITAARGSVPGCVGAKAIVTAEGRVGGNLGGGKVEARAIQQAIDQLHAETPCMTLTWNLQRDIGMTCGGEMTFLFEKLAARKPWHLAVFGAGHVSQALVPLLATLPCRVDVFDPRAEWLSRFQPAANVRLHQVDAFEDGVDFLNPASYVISITQGHASDRPVLREALRRFPQIPFFGVIGSGSKRAVLLRELREDGLDESLLARIHCPVGLPIGGNDPAEIAISIAAQLLEVRGCPALESPADRLPDHR